MKNFINISDLSKNELRSIIDNAKKRKSERGKKPNSEPDLNQSIQGKTMIMFFAKPSTRTRISFDLAVKQLGGSSIILNQDEIHYGKGDETIKDTAKVLSQYADILMIRTDSHKDIDEFKNLVSQNSDLSNIQDSINIEAKSFAFTLDDFAKALGDFRGFDVSNYAELTALANAQWNANWSVEEYASAYQIEVDVINQLQSGAIDSFAAGKIARNLGADIQEVADTIAAASSAGISVDLDAVAQGAGYDSFAAAVDAYNAQYGTNYTVDQAREALGQN